MDADVGDGITPVRGGRIDGVEIGQVESGEEISLYITNPMLHAPFGLNRQLLPDARMKQNLFESLIPSTPSMGKPTFC